MTMMTQPGKVPGGTGAPQIKAWPYSGGTFKKGAAMIISANIAAEAAANPTANLIGISAQPVDSNLGFQAANSPLQVTGRNTTCSIFQANRLTIFRSVLTNASDVEVTPATADVGTSYGLRKIATGIGAGIWCADKAATACLKVYDFEVNSPDPFVYWKFLEAALAIP